MNQRINRDFKIWAYTLSHSFLIIRGLMKFPDQGGYNDDTNYNIDIEFSAVAYLDIPTTFNGIKITEINNDIPEKLKDFKFDLNYKIFQIETQENSYYIVAGNYRIGTNTWINDDRIQNLNLGYDRILETS